MNATHVGIQPQSRQTNGRSKHSSLRLHHQRNALGRNLCRNASKNHAVQVRMTCNTVPLRTCPSLLCPRPRPHRTDHSQLHRQTSQLAHHALQRTSAMHSTEYELLLRCLPSFTHHVLTLSMARREGLRVSLDFFDDVLIPEHALQVRHHRASIGYCTVSITCSCVSLWQIGLWVGWAQCTDC